MKKQYKCTVDKDAFILEQKEKPKNQFIVDLNNLQFDTKTFYEVVFSDVDKRVEVVIEKDESILKLAPEQQKRADHVYETITSIINQVCEKLNEK